MWEAYISLQRWVDYHSMSGGGDFVQYLILTEDCFRLMGAKDFFLQLGLGASEAPVLP